MSFGIPVRNGLGLGLLASTSLATGNVGVLGPALYLPFALTGTLDSRITYSRPSLATMFDSTGKLTFCPNNFFIQSANFANAAWVKGASTFAANVITAPDGTLTAGKLEEDNTLNQHNIAQSAVVTTGNVIFSFYAKAAERSIFWVYSGNGQGRYFNLANGTLGGIISAAPAASNIESVGNGWYRCSIVTNTTTSLNYIVGVSIADGTLSYTGTTGFGAYIWGAQVEAVTYETTPRTYNATTAAAYYGPRFDYNPATLVARGLLIEEARTNLCLYSQLFTGPAWTKTATSAWSAGATGPDGLASSRFTGGAASSTYEFYQGITGVSGSSYTWSIYAKAGTANWLAFYAYDATPNITWFDLSNGVVGTNAAGNTATITAVGGGWYRCTLSRVVSGTSLYFDIACATANGSATTSGSVYLDVFGAQLELGAFATSYIPTAASSVARSADSATMTGANFSSWYNQSEGTFVINYTRVSGTSIILQAANAGGSNYHNFYSYSLFTVCETVNTTQQALTQLTTSVSGVPQDVAYGYKANDFAGCVDGTSPVLDPAGTVPSDLNRLSLGLAIVGSGSLNGWLAALTYYNTRLPNATLQSLTLPVIADYYFLVDANGDQITDASGNPLYTQPLYL